MRRLMVWSVGMGSLLTTLGCGITDRQLQDFYYSTIIRVVVQTAVSVFEAAVMQGQ